MSDAGNETWMPIPDFAGYEVSDLGRVRSWKKRGRPVDRLIRTEPVLLSTRICGRDLVGVWICKPPRGTLKWFAVRTLVLRVFVREPEKGEIAEHLNGDKADCRLANLAWTKRTATGAFAYQRRGVLNPRAAFKDMATIEAIRARSAAGEKVSVLATEFGVSDATISRIRNGRAYRQQDEER